MYQTGQQVLYGIHGVCSITGTETRRFGKSKAEYYVLQPANQPDSTFYVPVNNPAALAKLRPLMTRQEILDLLHSDQVRRNIWISDENQRKARYREMLNQGDRSELLSMIYCLHRHREEQQRLGRKFHQCDVGFLKDAEKLMNAEFSHVLGLEPSQIGPFILKEMKSGDQTSA